MKNQKQTIRKIVTFLNNDEEEGGFWLPNIQRPFVWSEEQICRLFDSILREYPISTLLIWKTTSTIRHRKFIDNWKYTLRLSDFYVPTNAKKKCLVLDGQQRLQSLFIGLCGSFEGKELCFDILSGEVAAPDDVKYKFKFLPPASITFPWVKFKDLVFTIKKQREVLDSLQAAAGPALTKDENDKLKDHLDLIDRTFKMDEALTYQELDSIDNPALYKEDDVVEVFIRANSGGTKLGKSDLLFSLLSASWDVADEKMEDLLESLNTHGFAFDRDFVLKTRGGFVTQPLATSSKDDRPNLRYPITINGREIWPEKQWIWAKDRVEAAIANDEVVVNETNGKVSVRVKQYLKDENGDMREMKPLSIMIGPFNQEGSKEMELLLGDGVFSFPKPVGLIAKLLSLTINDEKDEDALILDFFAGSGTTGHAVLRQNKDDGGARRYILVQLPEPLDPENKDQKTAAAFCDKLKKPRNLAEVCKERLRRAGKKTREENPMFAGDLGFRVFKLASSNIRAWEPDRDNLATTLHEHTEHLKADRTEQDILFELLLKLGLDLTVPIEQKCVAGKTVHSIGAGVLLVCLAEQIATAEVESLALGIAAWHKELAPVGESQVVFRDSAFTRPSKKGAPPEADDVAKTNLAAILQQNGLENVRSL